MDVGCGSDRGPLACKCKWLDQVLCRTFSDLHSTTGFSPSMLWHGVNGRSSCQCRARERGRGEHQSLCGQGEQDGRSFQGRTVEKTGARNRGTVTQHQEGETRVATYHPREWVMVLPAVVCGWHSSWGWAVTTIKRWRVSAGVSLRKLRGLPLLLWPSWTGTHWMERAENQTYKLSHSSALQPWCELVCSQSIGLGLGPPEDCHFCFDYWSVLQ